MSYRKLEFIIKMKTTVTVAKVNRSMRIVIVTLKGRSGFFLIYDINS